MKNIVFAFGLGACSLVVAAAGEIRGRITISRPLTKDRVAVSTYQARGLFVPERPSKNTVGDEISRVAIYLQDEGLPAASPINLELIQEKRQFSDEVVIVPAGSTVAFPNRDPIFHNVFSLSKARPFDLGYYPMNESRSVKFERPGVVQVYCHIHRDMNAAVVVVPSRWYGRPDPDGRFSMTGVPPGKHQLVVWHKSAGFFRRTVDVPAEGSIEITMDVPVEETK